ncbi:RHS repeat-associated core domain-containing protein [Streptomyces sp. NPDC002486]
MVDDAGKRTHTYTHGPTGMPRGTTTETVPQPHRYPDSCLDPTGRHKMGHRYYAPSLGCFTQPDPSGQEANPCLYAAGDPVNNSDSTGLFSPSDALDAGESIFSTATGCRAGINAAGESGIMAGPWGTAAAVVGQLRRPRPWSRSSPCSRCCKASRQRNRTRLCRSS